MRTKRFLTRSKAPFVICGVLLACSGGCGRNLVFTTYTMFGVEIKGEGTMPTALRLAYKRFEGALIPVDISDDAKAHSVLATIDARQGAFHVHISQVFATGRAAKIAADLEGAQGARGEPGPLSDALRAAKGIAP